MLCEGVQGITAIQCQCLPAHIQVVVKMKRKKKKKERKERKTNVLNYEINYGLIFLF